MTNEPDDETTEEPKKETIHDSVAWVVNMMNEGGANPDHVYPRGNRYHGD